MKTSLSNSELIDYVFQLLEVNFPDKNNIKIDIGVVVEQALEKCNFCFDKVNLKHYYLNDSIFFNHLNSDQFTVFLAFCANISFFNFKNRQLAEKFFYLNKIRHGFHCMFDTKVPDVFLVIHGSGIVMGKASYSNFFVIHQGCTVGMNNFKLPIFDEYVVMYPNSTILGDSHIKNHNVLGIGVTLKDQKTSAETIFTMDDGLVKERIKNNIKIMNYFFK